VQRFVKQYQETGDLSAKKPGGRPGSILEAHKEIVENTVEEHPDWTLEQYCEEVGQKTGEYVSRSTMCVFLKKVGLSLKKKTFRSAKAASEDGQKQRLEYWQKVKEVKAENLIFIDETGIWEGMERSVARSPKGKRAFSYREKYKGQKHTVIGAISLDGVVCVKTIKASMKGEDFRAFLRDDLSPKLNADKVVVMDNLNTHKAEEAQQIITATGAKTLFLSTYSPDFNPIEMLWSVLKSFIRKFKTQDWEKMQAVLKMFFLLLDHSFFRNWFAKCCYCTP